MSLSIKQFAALLIILLTMLVAAFAYQVHDNLTQSRQLIEKSNEQQARNELENTVSIMLRMVRQSAQELSSWQEIKQQINNPDFFDLLKSAGRIETIHTQETTLENIFIEVTGQELSA